jgi:hypothetical protein
MGLPAILSVPLRLALLVFMIWVSIAISRVVCCATFTMSAEGMMSPTVWPAFKECHAGHGEPALFVMSA